jgi:hypothetical protein
MPVARTALPRYDWLMNAPRTIYIFGGLVTVAALAGCQTTPSRVPAPPTPLELVSAAPLVIQTDCQIDGAVLVEYTVLESGRTGNIQVSPAPDCARVALSAWVASYRYTPQSTDISARFEWILVSARRGS